MHRLEGSEGVSKAALARLGIIKDPHNQYKYQLISSNWTYKRKQANYPPHTNCQPVYDFGAKDGTKRAILRLISMYLCCKFLSC